MKRDIETVLQIQFEDKKIYFYNNIDKENITKQLIVRPIINNAISQIELFDFK